MLGYIRRYRSGKARRLEIVAKVHETKQRLSELDLEPYLKNLRRQEDFERFLDALDDRLELSNKIGDLACEFADIGSNWYQTDSFFYRNVMEHHRQIAAAMRYSREVTESTQSYITRAKLVLNNPSKEPV